MPASLFHADHAWLPHGWEDDVALTVEGGRFLRVDADAAREGATPLGRFVLPGMANLHSHAFQRAMAGLAERQSHSEDSFWTWRETMYAFAGRVGPDELRAIAAQLYVEMLEAGYTQVCEFHYLHHQPGGVPYADAAAMSLALVEAAQETGIGLTLLPTLYMTGGFDGRALGERQRRFGHTLDAYLALVQCLRGRETDRLRIGVALHSLRAVDEGALKEVAQAVRGRMPVHIHISEQQQEVADCLERHGKRPIEFLMDRVALDERWNLVHATQADRDELAQLRSTGAAIVICPSTEANLGDGVFVTGDHRETSGIAAALRSGRRTAAAVLAELGVDNSDTSTG